MAIQAKSRRTPARRRTVVVASRVSRNKRPGTTVRRPESRKVAEVKPVSTGINSFSRAQRYLASLSDFEKLRIVRYNSQNFDLDRMRLLLKKLGNPQDHFKSVHVAGTKGKGTTCAMIASMLRANGYKVGVYTSPHLCDIRERIVVNGEMIPHSD